MDLIRSTAGRGAVTAAVFRSAFVTARLLARGRLAMPRDLVGTRLALADGTRSVVFRETAAPHPRPPGTVVLVVRFRLRWIGDARWAHAVFRRTCLVNTPLFAGFPGFRTKLWLTDPATGVYRGLYEWDDALGAAWYAERLRHVLALVTCPGSVSYEIVPDTTREPYVAGWRPVPTGSPDRP